MGKPRLIILIRHAQSEGNKNREIRRCNRHCVTIVHFELIRIDCSDQMIPDHRVKLTDEGLKQARHHSLPTVDRHSPN